MDENLKQHPEFHNFVSVFRGFVYVGKVLEPYTTAGLRVLQDGYKLFAGLPPCTQRCSAHNGRDTTQWCPTCRTWQTYLLQKHRNLRVRWENTKSWEWNHDYNSIAYVFLPPTWSDTDTQLHDFTTACYIWSNCKEFNLTKPLIQTLRHLRNKQVGHNTKLKVTDSNKVKVFDELKKLLSCNAVQPHIDLSKCKQELENIAKVDEMTSVMPSLFKELETIGSAQNNHGVCLNDIVTILNTVNERIIKLPTDIQNKPRQSYKAPSWKLTSLTVFVLLMITMSYVKYPQNEECLSEMYSYPFPQDMPLIPYVKEHASLIGREWLFDEIKTLIFQRNSRTRGVLLTADIGYGKSAIVKHLLCSKNDEKVHDIIERTLAFHICKFDVPSTRHAQRFVYRIIGFLATQFPEFGGIISMLPETALIFDHETCGREIVACFDQGIIHPLKELKIKPLLPFIVLIDGLDECIDDKTKDSELFQLILSRYRKMPKWIKFIVTSRNISIVHRLHDLTNLHLKALDQRNVIDIKNFVKYKATRYPGIFNEKASIDTMLEKSEGNFLFVQHLINYLLVTDDATKDDFPNTLSEVYEINFERHFSQDKNFKTAKSILELVVASLQPLARHEVEAILEYTNPTVFGRFPDTFEKLRFCFRSTEELTIVHQSLHVWLISDENRQFQISIENGHAMLSKYLLGKVADSNRTLDTAEITIHVANSKSPVLRKAFEAASDSFYITKSSIHRLIWKSDSEDALKLLLKLNVKVDTLSKGNVTPAFVAAARGHLDQLKYLTSKGADLNFIVYSSYRITSSKQIDIIKHEYYSGYGLIHIATQFGHVNIVEYLLKQNKSIAHTRNGLRLTVLEMACENGHLAILNLVGKHVSDYDNCAYYAAKNGHTNIIRHMIKLGVNATCVSIGKANDAFNNITLSDFSKPVLNFRSNDIKNSYEIYDLWWVVHQESALHVAISTHHSEIAKLLVHNYPHLVECEDSNGMVPFLLSVAENETNLFPVLIDRVARDKCSHSSILARTTVDEKLKTCPLGASYAHLDAIYGRFELTKVLFVQRIEVDWLLPDAMSVTAVHYAACNGNIIFLYFIKHTLKLSYNDIRTSNGSSPFHSAAMCGSAVAIYVMTSELSNNIPNLKDSENKTVLHYLVLRDFSGHQAILAKSTQSIYVSILMEISKNSAIILNETDCYKRNVIHYALKNGFFMVVDYFYWHHSDLLASMLEQEDINGSTPVKYAVSNGSWNLESSSSSVVQGLLKIIHFLKSDMYRHFLPIFHELVNKSPTLTAAVLLELKKPALGVIKTQFIQSIRKSPLPSSVFMLAMFRPKLFSTCGKSLQESPLHLMAYTCKDMHFLQDRFFYGVVFGSDDINITALSCADRDGYNIFHYALLAGNIRMARMLFDIGVYVTNKRVLLADIPWMVLFGRKATFDSFIALCSDQLSCMDDILYQLFKQLGSKFNYSDICNENKYRLSLVHVIGASGFSRTLKILKELFGLKVITCNTIHGITPAYLGDLWNEMGWRATLQAYETPRPSHLHAFRFIHILFSFIEQKHPHNCVFSASSYDTYTSQTFIDCFARYPIIVYETIGISRFLKQVHSVLQMFENACWVESKFQTALTTKNVSEIHLYLENVTNMAITFENMFSSFDVNHNYRGLKKLISLKGKRMSCNLNETQFENELSCFKVAVEYNHMLRKIITTLKSEWFQIGVMDFEFFNTILINTTLEQGILGDAYKLASNMNPLFAKVGSIHSYLHFFRIKARLNPYLAGLIFEHSYLHILKKTTKYQYVKKPFPEDRSSITNYFNPNVVSGITKPFDTL